MTPSQASQKLADLPHLSSLNNFPPKDLPLRQTLIATVEAGCQDHKYINDRNRLIPQASRLADALTGSPIDGDHPGYCLAWSRHFLAKMDLLWAGTHK